MKKIASILLIFSILISSVNLAYGKRYKYSHEYKYYKYESLRPLIWAGAIYIGILSVKEIVFIPEERKYKEKELELLNLEIEKKKRELEFIYNPPPGWDTTPWGIKFMKDLSTRYYFEE